jgi:hypothetical protein
MRREQSHFSRMDQQIARPIADVGHRFDSVHNQVEAICCSWMRSPRMSGKFFASSVCSETPFRSSSLRVTSMTSRIVSLFPEQFAPRHLDDLEDRFVDVQRIMSWRHLLDEGADAADDVAGSIAVLDDGIEGLPDLVQIRGVAGGPAS